MEKKYKFVGPGQGVPGLPHEITDEEARTLGVEEILEAALKSGVYEEMKPPSEKKPKAKEE